MGKANQMGSLKATPESKEIRQAGGLAWPGLAKSDSASASARPEPDLELPFDWTSLAIILLCSAWPRPGSAWLGLARPGSA